MSTLISRASRPLRFGAVGIVNTLVGAATIVIAKLGLELGDVPANAMGYSAGLACSYLLNRAWTFRFRGSTARSLGAFLALFTVCYGLNLAVLLVMRDVLAVDAWWGQGAALCAYTVAFYFGSSRLVFRQRHV